MPTGIGMPDRPGGVGGHVERLTTSHRISVPLALANFYRGDTPMGGAVRVSNPVPWLSYRGLYRCAYAVVRSQVY